MGPKGVLIKDEEDEVVKYVVDMLKMGHPLTPTDLKMKVAEITQLSAIFF